MLNFISFLLITQNAKEPPTDEEHTKDAEKEKRRKTRATISILSIRLCLFFAFICGLICTDAVVFGVPPTWVCDIMSFCIIASLICLVVGGSLMPMKDCDDSTLPWENRGDHLYY